MHNKLLLRLCVSARAVLLTPLSRVWSDPFRKMEINWRQHGDFLYSMRMLPANSTLYFSVARALH